MNRCLLFVTLSSVLLACDGSEETFVVQEQDFNEAVYASGQIMPAHYQFMEVNTPDRIIRILVDEGNEIDSGSVIAVLGTPSENRQLEILTRQVSLARDMAGDQSAVLDELKSRIRLARERYLQDSLNAVRYEELASERAVPLREAEQASLQSESSRTEFLALQQQYQSRSNELNRNLLQAEQQLAQLGQSREGKLLASPFHGKVFRVYHDEGSLVQPGEPVALVGDAENSRLELLVDERDINKIKLGQRVYFQTEMHADQQFEAKISKIIPVLQKETRSFEVEADVYTNNALYPQSSVEANIIIRENARVLVIPADYLLSGDSVNVKTGDEVQKKSIEAGSRNGQWVEVISGLKAGDTIVKKEQ
ncbi:efflux RND transporter periplasmic adaptor subunit [Catalinimonas niigatensis]|uniref:efflux RND transporter periplasmic adaptor subunit n=1 Tax=Catalinimonas niigatensis TaxID=1397264 RepID=UPI002665E1AE|nr:HlyD family efflux transporter periplasmic adaptor subunit [Catalinimonas niigatensis]WPP52824.1 efflux RND transporter periplasmic adaptor subunit [Catalinimonas niigatensis]